MDLKHSSGNWEWGDGSSYSWSAWLGAEPSGDCGVGSIADDYKWVNEDCNNFATQALILCEVRGEFLSC